MPLSPSTGPATTAPRPSILDISRIILKRKWIILLCLLVSIGLAGVFSRSRGSSYRTQASVEIQQVSYAMPGGNSYS